jgi:hypothetical protein
MYFGIFIGRQPRALKIAFIAKILWKKIYFCKYSRFIGIVLQRNRR